MKNTSLFPAVVLLGLLTFLCCKKEIDEPGNNDGCPTTDFNDLVVQKLSDTALTTSQVSVVFKVDAKDGSPVARLQSESFTILEKAENENCYEAIDPFEAGRRIVLDPQRFRHSTILVLDLSKSVTQNFLADLKTSAKSFIENVMTDTTPHSYEMGIYWFDGSPQLFRLQGFTTNKAILLAAIDGITANLCVDCNSTNLFGAVVTSADTAVARYNFFKNQDIISGAAVVIFTDGDDQAGIKSLAQATTAITSAKTKTSDNVKFFTVGLGAEAELNHLKALGVDGFNFATDKTQLEQTFQETAQSVSDEANSYYNFEYCSPKRAGKVGLKIIAKDANGKQGTLTYEFDAAKFVGPFNCQ